ncbi:hypothetical protein K432DRAFT_306532 [Lepidopterella palustris CBS 459.81]|uniref:Uncharacterized protein n=1 Tax=Lepidopterella palustris CBS 459.81 TaxID=1314670 RepID=A0A8E2E329_9PEZI|nr:hypothetical protein K432DRAFT_306532 [Lepidopterella palustris CBS 459.81]
MSDQRPSTASFRRDLDLSIEALFKALEVFQTAEEAKEIERLEKQNAILRHKVRVCRKSWYLAVNLLYESFNVMLSLHNAIRECNRVERMANKDWLAFWGINAEPSQHTKYKLMGWI